MIRPTTWLGSTGFKPVGLIDEIHRQDAGATLFPYICDASPSPGIHAWGNTADRPLFTCGQKSALREGKGEEETTVALPGFWVKLSHNKHTIRT